MHTHHFQPTHYHTTIGSHEPVLHISPGDTVITTAVDAAGCDATGNQVTPPGNPQTGPFFVEGAEPGDVLVFRIEALRPTRVAGFSATVLAENVVDPDAVRTLPEPQGSSWQIDFDAGAVQLARPRTRLGHLTLPLAPMLGCFGVAPPRGQAISTATSGAYGGNMDYRGLGQGVTVYFPVFVPGALLHLGDAHAVQGDGEIVGTGVEVSCEVRFTVDLIKGRAPSWPRGENSEYIFTLGNARPLDQALQHATTEMTRWLVDEYGLDLRAASILLGQGVRYEVGNVYDPAYTIVCKVPKKVLAQIPVV
ncbi:MAG TPA: acetamidase/formamidase family protein [Chloroflexota bacterium]|nr:acetamidase/formamidase family protein [Chloroflexota bacterium]